MIYDISYDLLIYKFIINRWFIDLFISISHHHTHSLCLSASPHRLSSPLRVVGRFYLSHIHTFICFGIDFCAWFFSSFSANQLALSTTLFPQVNDSFFFPLLLVWFFVLCLLFTCVVLLNLLSGCVLDFGFRVWIQLGMCRVWFLIEFYQLGMC